MTPDQIRRARCVIDWLVTAEPGKERAESPDAWLAHVTKRIKAQRWDEVCAAIEANPDLSATTIAERLSGKPVKPIPPVTQPEPEPDAGPVLTRNEVRDRLATARAALSATTKPPIPESESA